MTLQALTLSEARRRILGGDLTSRAYAEALIEANRAAAALNAFCDRDDAALIEAADRCDADCSTRDPALVLAGIPIGLKDNIDTLQLTTTGGTGALRGHRPGRNADVAALLFAAGALLAGKTNMHELAFGISTDNVVTGATRNPWNPAMSPGGSSGGSAAAVAARLVPAAIGTDTICSVRHPAALCGVVGFRPGIGRYPSRGILPISRTRDTAGVLARSVEDVRLVDQVISRQGEPAAVALRGLRIGLPRAYFFADLDDALAPVVERAIDRLRAEGVVFVEAEIEEIGKLTAIAGFPIALYEVVEDIPAYLASIGSSLTLADLLAGVGGADVRGYLEPLLGGRAVPRAAYEQSLEARHRLRTHYAEYFTRHGVAAILFPTSSLPARPLEDAETVELNGVRVPAVAAYIRNTDPSSTAGLPGISLPAGLTRDGLPVGIELDGPEGGDVALLAVAQAVEGALDSMPSPPCHELPS